MKCVLPLFIFVDACGWEIIRTDPFARSIAPCRKRIRSVLGYSSACVPSILSGRWPAEHRNWSYFVYDPAHSPFRFLRPLHWLPSSITGRRKFRQLLSRLVKRKLKFQGYFDLYNIPFQHISCYDFSEKKSPLRPGGMNRGNNIFDYLEENGIAYHASAPEATELQNLSAALAALKSGKPDFAFVYWPGLDALLHQVGNLSPRIGEKLRLYEDWIDRLLEAARGHYQEVNLYILSDHGMANCEQLLDLKAKIETLPVAMGQDYAVVYDSTMARFWFFHDRARTVISNALASIPEGRILPKAELIDLGAWFPDGYFGELIFLVREGVLIVPSDMGARPITGMHGYHPDEQHSFAMICSNQSAMPDDVSAIPHFYNLMTREASQANERNANGRQPVLVSDEMPGSACVSAK